MPPKKSKLMRTLTRKTGGTNVFANKQDRTGDATTETVASSSRPGASVPAQRPANTISPQEHASPIRPTPRSAPVSPQGSISISSQTRPDLSMSMSMTRPELPLQSTSRPSAVSQPQARAVSNPTSKSGPTAPLQYRLAIPPPEISLALSSPTHSLPTAEVKKIHKDRKGNTQKWKYGHASIQKDLRAAAAEKKTSRAPRKASGPRKQREPKQKVEGFDAGSFDSDILLLFKPNKKGLVEEAIVEKIEVSKIKAITPAITGSSRKRKTADSPGSPQIPRKKAKPSAPVAMKASYSPKSPQLPQKRAKPSAPVEMEASYSPKSPQLPQQKAKTSAPVDLKAVVDNKEGSKGKEIDPTMAGSSRSRRNSYLEIIMSPGPWDRKPAREYTPEPEIEPELMGVMTEPEEEEHDIEAELLAAMEEPEKEYDVESELLAAMGKPGEDYDIESELWVAMGEPEE